MAQDYKQISPAIGFEAYKEAWSMENRKAHEAEGRGVTYVGSEVRGPLDGDERNGRLVFDYYLDTAGAWWFENRALLPSGKIVSMEMYLFGHEIKAKGKAQK